MIRMGLQWPHADPPVRPAHTGDSRRRQNEMAEQQIAFLRSLPIFHDLSDEALNYLATESRQRVFQAGEIVCYQGDPGSTCHIIVHGRVRVFVIGEDGQELSVRFLGRGDIFGEMALFDDLPRSANVEALENTRTLELHRDVLFGCLQRSPALALSLLRALSERLRYATEEAGGLASLTVVERLLRRLQQLAEWAGTPTEDGVRITLPMNQQELATLIGTSRESVNRALVQLRRQGKVRLENGWIVLVDGVP